MKKLLRNVLFLCSILSGTIAVHAMDSTQQTQNTYQCQWDNCRLSFNDLSIFKEHINDHVKNMLPFHQGCLWLNCSYNGALSRHMKAHVNKPFTCPRCPAIFKLNNKLNTHLSLHKTGFSCSECSRVFTSTRGLGAHKKKHSPTPSTNTLPTRLLPPKKRTFAKLTQQPSVSSVAHQTSPAKRVRLTTKELAAAQLLTSLQSTKSTTQVMPRPQMSTQLTNASTHTPRAVLLSSTQKKKNDSNSAPRLTSPRRVMLNRQLILQPTLNTSVHAPRAIRLTHQPLQQRKKKSSKPKKTNSKFKPLRNTKARPVPSLSSQKFFAEGTVVQPITIVPPMLPNRQLRSDQPTLVPPMMPNRGQVFGISSPEQNALNQQLISALQKESFDVFDLQAINNMLQAGANPNTNANTAQLTPLTYAVRKNNPELLKMLVHYGAKHTPNTEYVDNLEYAIRYKYYQLVPELVKLYPQNEALKIAAKLKDVFTVKEVYKKEAQAAGGILFYAIKNNMVGLTNFLLKNGESPNTVHQKYTYTPLHKACANVNIPIMSLLINHKADVNAQTKFSNTPLHRLTKTNNNQFAQTAVAKLLFNGANRHIRNKAGYTPLELAIKNKADGNFSRFELFGYPTQQRESVRKIISFVDALLNNDSAARQKLTKRANNYIAKLRANKKIKKENIQLIAGSITRFLDILSNNSCLCSRYLAIIQASKQPNYFEFYVAKKLCELNLMASATTSNAFKKCRLNHAYNTLCVEQNASFDQIETVYKKLMSRNNTPNAKQKLKNAYIMLKNNIKNK